MKNAFKLLIMFLVGCCLYITIEIFFRGFSFRLMGITGGIIFIIGASLNNWFSWDMDWILQCLIIGLLVTVVEVFIGNIDYYYLHLNMWDYSNMPLNFFNAKICVPFSFIWCLFGIPITLLGDILDYYVFHVGIRPYYVINGKVILELPERKCEQK